MKNKIGIIFGGKSGEHEVSLMSAKSVIENIDKEKYQVVPIGVTHQGEWIKLTENTEQITDGSWIENGKPINISSLKDEIDFALPLIHGSYGEDGKLQGLLEILDIPYAGCGVASSALCMDKALAKDVLSSKNIPVSDYLLIRDFELLKDNQVEMQKLVNNIIEKLGETVFVKPSNAGSSLGISKATGLSEIIAALSLASQYDRRILVEECINAREIETGIIGNYYGQIEAASVGEIIPTTEFYSYESKYGENSGTKLSIPALISDELQEKIKTMGIEVYEALDCSGFARVDFFLEKDTGRLIVNEVNTLPGFTKYSMFPLLWQDKGLEFSEIIDRIVESGYERYNNQNKRKTEYR